MPTYDYECRKCGHRFELFQSISAAPRKQCPKCRGAVRRMIGTGAGLLFKGSGFYTTDYRSDSYRKSARAEKGGAAAAPAAGKPAGGEKAPAAARPAKAAGG